MNDENSIEEKSMKDLYFEGLLLEKVLALPEEIQIKTEAELEGLFNPTPTDHMLRRRYSERLNFARENGITRITASEIYTGICSKQHFYAQFISNSAKLAWMLLPVKSHQESISEAFAFALERVRKEVLTMPITEKSAPVLLKAAEWLANRHLGLGIQKIEQKTLNIDGNKLIERTVVDPNDLLQRISDLKRDTAKLVSPPEPGEPT